MTKGTTAALRQNVRFFVSTSALLVLVFSAAANATYNANLSGVVTDVVTYSDAGVILIRLANQPSSHPACNAQYFAIDQTLPEKLIDRMMARVLTGLASGVPLNIGFDNAGNCAHGYIRIHRIG